MQIIDSILKTTSDSIPWRLFVPENDAKEYCVLWLQGWTSSMESHRKGVERMAGNTSLAFATLDYAGHGTHQIPLDKSSKEQQFIEVVAIFDELERLGYKKIIAIGGSFGGYMAALLPAARPVHAVVLRAPANYPDDEFELPYSETLRSTDYVAYMKTKESDDMLLNSAATKAIQQYDGYVYVLEHELDDDVPARIPKKYFADAEKGNYFIIPKTKHSPKLMKHPQPHFEYIEHVVAAILKAVQLQDGLDDE